MWRSPAPGGSGFSLSVGSTVAVSSWKVFQAPRKTSALRIRHQGHVAGISIRKFMFEEREQNQPLGDLLEDLRQSRIFHVGLWTTTRPAHPQGFSPAA